jgi:hypothetical protein
LRRALTRPAADRAERPHPGQGTMQNASPVISTWRHPTSFAEHKERKRA